MVLIKQSLLFIQRWKTDIVIGNALEVGFQVAQDIIVCKTQKDEPGSISMVNHETMENGAINV